MLSWRTLESHGVVLIVCINDCWKSRSSNLARVESIPALIHESIDLIPDFGVLLHDQDWLQCTIKLIFIQAFKHQHTDFAECSTDPSVVFELPLARKFLMRRETWVMWDQVEVW